MNEDAFKRLQILTKEMRSVSHHLTESGHGKLVRLGQLVEEWESELDMLMDEDEEQEVLLSAVIDDALSDARAQRPSPAKRNNGEVA